MKDEARVNQFNGWTKESQRRLIRDLNNLKPCDKDFAKFMNSLLEQ